MLKINPNPTFKLPIELPVAGEKEPVKFSLEVKYRGSKELDEFFGQMDKQQIEAVVRDTVVGWSDVDGPFTPEALDQVLAQYLGAGLVILKAYNKEVQKALLGN